MIAIAICDSNRESQSTSDLRQWGSVPTPVHVGTPGNGELVCSAFVCPDAARGCPVAVWFMSSQFYCTGFMLASRLKSGTRVFGVFAFCWPYSGSYDQGAVGGAGEPSGSPVLLSLRSIPRDLGGVPWAPSPPGESFWDL